MKFLVYMTILLQVVLGESLYQPLKSYSGKGGGVFIRIMGNDTETQEYQYRCEAFDYSEADGKAEVSLGAAAEIEIPGEPSLPYISQKFVIPRGYLLDSVTVVHEASEMVPLKSEVEFALAPVIPGRESPATIRNETVYQRDQLYPVQSGEVVSVQKSAGVSIGYVNIYPVQYNPVKNYLVNHTAFILRLHLTPQMTRSSTELPAYPERVRGTIPGIENSELLRSYSQSRSGVAASGQYLIITNEEFRNALVKYTVKDLAARRQAQGVTAKIVTVDSIYSAVEGVDRQQKIRYFLREAYANWGTEYVLIAGDTNIVPVRTLAPNGVDQWKQPVSYEDSISHFVPSDFYYQCLDGSYNTPNWSDKEGKYWGRRDGGQYNGMVDVAADLSIGRIPAENPLEFSNWVEKQFAYENIPFNDPRHANVFVAGEYLGFGDPGGIMEFAKNCMNEIRFGSDTSGGYSTKGFAAFDEIEVDTIFDIDRGGKDNPWGFDDISTAINSNKYSVIQHLGHGLEWEYMRIHRNSVSELQNTRPYFSYSQSCLPGRFTSDCVGEQLLVESNTSGIWGGIFNTAFGRGSVKNTDGISQRLNRHFWDGYFRENNPITRIGKLNSYSHSMMIDRIKFPGYLYGIYSISLLGDPFAEMRLVRPSASSYLYLTNPVGGNPLALDREIGISWHSAIDEAMVLSLLDSADGKIELATVQGKVGEFLWTPSNDATAGNGYRMVIEGSTSADTSLPFSVMEHVPLAFTSFPEQGITKGEETIIEWSGSDSLVSLWLLKNGSVVQELSPGLNTGSFTWNIPLSLVSGSDYALKVIGSESRDREVVSEQFSVYQSTVREFPYTENFENAELGSTLPGAWEQSFSDDADWLVHSGPTPTKETTHPQAVKCGPSFGNGGTGNYCYVEASGDNNPNKRLELLTPILDLRGASGATLKFWLHMFTDSVGLMGDFSVDILFENGTEKEIFRQSGRLDSDDWYEQTVSLADAEGHNVQLRFVGVTSESYSSDMAIDDIEVSVEQQGEVSLVTKNNGTATKGIYVVPSIVTADASTASLYVNSEEPFSFRWALFDHVGNLVAVNEGEYYGGESIVDVIDTKKFPRVSGALVLFLEATLNSGERKLYKTTLGVKR